MGEEGRIKRNRLFTPLKADLGSPGKGFQAGEAAVIYRRRIPSRGAVAIF